MRYQWQIGTSPLQEIVFSGGKKAPSEALIFAPAETTDAIADMHRLFISKGMHVSYDIVENRPVLRVGGFAQETEVLTLLKENGLINGEAKTEAIKSEKQPFDKFMGAAFFYQLGNITGFIGDYLRKDKAGMTSNAAFITGDTTMLAFGRKTIEEKQIALMQGFGEILQQNGIGVEAGSPFAPAHTQNLPGGWNAFRRFMMPKVVGIKAASEVVAGLKKVQAGFNQGNTAKSLAGGLIASGFAAGALIPEKTLPQLRDEYGVGSDEELKGKISQLPFFKRILVTIQRTPLILSGLFSGLNNVFSILGAVDENKYIKKNNESRKQTELNVRLSEKGGTFVSSVFGVKEKSTTLDNNDKDPKNWTAGKILADATEKYETALADSSSTDKQKIEALDAKYKAEKNLSDLKEDKNRLAKGRHDFPTSKFWMFDLAQSLFFLVGNYFYANSPKGGSMVDRQKLSDRFFSAIATHIATAPQDQKDYLFAVACQYAGDTRDLGVTVREAQVIISDKIAQIEANPWLKHRLATPVLAKAETSQELLETKGRDDHAVSTVTTVTPPKIETTIPLQPPVEERADHPSVAAVQGKPPAELLDLTGRDDRKPESPSHAASIAKQEKPLVPLSLIERAMMENPPSMSVN